MAINIITLAVCDLTSETCNVYNRIVLPWSKYDALVQKERLQSKEVIECQIESRVIFCFSLLLSRNASACYVVGPFSKPPLTSDITPTVATAYSKCEYQHASLATSPLLVHLYTPKAVVILPVKSFESNAQKIQLCLGHISQQNRNSMIYQSHCSHN